MTTDEVVMQPTEELPDLVLFWTEQVLVLVSVFFLNCYNLQ